MVGKTHIGKIRRTNQDSIFFNNAILAVADGMGGHAGGEVASAIAIKTLEISLASNPDVNLTEIFSNADKNVREEAERNPFQCYKMGTTLVVARIQGNRLVVGNVGDSRAYLVSPRRIEQITIDHNPPFQKNLLTQIVGHCGVPDLFEKSVDTGDIVLLCSDGLSNMVDDSIIFEIVRETEFQEICDKLIQAALDAGGLDNISVVISKV